MDQLMDIGAQFVNWLVNLLDAWGYLIVFVGTTLENIFVVGSFTPGEVLVISATAVASRGALLASGVWVASVLGTLLGSNISYWVGRRQGDEALERVARVVRMKSLRLDDAQEYFERHGAKTIFLARFATGIKNLAPLIAGVGRMSIFWFEAYTLLGAVVYTSLMVGIGWYLGENIDKAVRVASSIGWFGLLLVISLIVLLVLRRRMAREGGDE